MTALSFSIEAGATRFKGMGVVDKETLVVRFQTETSATGMTRPERALLGYLYGIRP